MTRIETACYALLASAFVLGGLLLYSAGGIFEQKAQAEMVIAQQSFSLMTAQTREGEEALFVLDNSTGALIVYRLNVGRKRLELATAIDLNQVLGGR